MITLTAKPGVNHAAFKAAMHARYTDWIGNVQICHVAQRNSDGSKRIAIRINPLRGFRLPPDVQTVAEQMLMEVGA